MKKATKVIVSGLAGLTLLASGIGVGVGATHAGLWDGGQNVEETTENLFELDGKIHTLKQDKASLQEDIKDLQTAESEVTASLKLLVEKFAPQYKNAITKENMPLIVEFINENAGPASDIVTGELVKMEQQLAIKKPASNLLDRLLVVQDELAGVTNELNNKELKLHNVVEKVNELTRQLSGSQTEKEALQSKLDDAQLDVQLLKELSDRIVEEHKDVPADHSSHDNTDGI